MKAMICKPHNIINIKMNLLYLPEYIDNYFKDRKKFGFDILYSIEKKFHVLYP